MNFVLIITLTTLLALANCQTPITTSLCPSGQYNGYVAYDFTKGSSPVTGLDGTASNYAPNGIYKVTMANGADQCCNACATQTSGKCTSWTYDGCGNCYLSSSTGSSNYLTSGTAGKSVCSGYTSGFVSSSVSPTTTTTSAVTITVPLATSTATSNFPCQVVVGQYSASPSSTTDTYTTAADASTCCNKCGATPDCVGFAFLTDYTACWLKSYNPTAASNLVSFPGMIIGNVIRG